jgi:hypothetical protein
VPATLVPLWDPPGTGADSQPDEANCARVHDALLGGAHCFAADRDLAARLQAAVPVLPSALYAERRFLDHAIRMCLDDGIAQFLDLGCGLPAVGNARAVIGRLAPAARVVCVDLDAVVVAALTRDLIGNDQAAIIKADIQESDEILDHPATCRLLDPREPVAVLATNVLHRIDQPQASLGRLMDRLPAGTVLVATHLTTDHHPHEVATLMNLATAAGIPWISRTRTQVEALFTGLALADPGLVDATAWHPDPRDPLPDGSAGYILAAVGRNTTVNKLASRDPRPGSCPEHANTEATLDPTEAMT